MKNHSIHKISAGHLSVEMIREIISENKQLELSEEAIARITGCRNYLDEKMKNQKEPIYGITTGFGSLCNIRVNEDELSTLQRNLVMSHACGTGDEVPREIVKIILLLKIQSLAYGFSGVQLITVERLISFFNLDILPVIYQQGSLGASGDLSPLAHLSLPLLGMGEVEYQGRRITGAELMHRMGWTPIELKSKEGLSLLNGTQFMSAYGVWALIRSFELVEWADTIGALSLDAFDGRIEPFHPAVHRVRPHRGQIETAANISNLLEGSELINRSKAHVQDPYSFRCMPQVHGASRDSIRYVGSVFDTEINSATDNPTVIPEEDLIISAGNFHGQPLAITMDFLAIAVAELGSISGQRIYQLIKGCRDLPKFLVALPGLNSGFMIPQYTVASIVSQSKQLCAPASVDSIESSQGQEDHVSMGANAATKLYRVVQNTQRVLAVELFNAAQALEFRRPLKTSPQLEALVARYRKQVPFIQTDEVMYTHIEASVQFLINDGGK
ncbi:MAG: histidine ammonia-lyase [Bacteroidales bacterium]